MGDNADSGGLDSNYDYYGGVPTEVWDPYLGQNVYIAPTGGGTSESGHVIPTSTAPSTPWDYVYANPEHYEGYTGPVAYANPGPANYVPLTVEGLTYPLPTSVAGATPADYYRAYDVAHQQQAMNPYAVDYQPIMGEALGEALNDVYVMPAVRPNVGYIPDYGAIDLRYLTPFAWQDEDYMLKSSYNPLTAEEHALTSFFTDLDATPFPKFSDPDVGGEMVASEGLNFPGRGYEYAGEPSPELQDVNAQILAGNITPQTVMARDEMVQPMIQAIEKSDLQKAMDIVGPAGISAIMTIMAPYAAPATWGTIGAAAFGAGAGALTSGIFSKWEDPLAIGLGALGGGLGGWGGQVAGEALAGASGLTDAAGALTQGGKILTGAASGFGGGVGGYVGRSAASGFDDFDPLGLGTAGLTGAVSGSVGALGADLAGGGPYGSAIGRALGQGVGHTFQATDIFGNSTRRRRSPY